MDKRLACSTIIKSSIDSVFRVHNGNGIQISTICCDQEFEELPLYDEVKDGLDIEMNCDQHSWAPCWAAHHQIEAEAGGSKQEY